MRFAFFLCLLACACGGGGGGVADASDEEIIVVTPDAGADDVSVVDANEASTVVHNPDAGYPAPHPAVPQVLNYSNGPVLTAPNVVPIFFMNDPSEATIESFMTQLAASTFWGSTTNEYGVGPLTIADSIVVTDTPPVTITDDQIQEWLANYLDGTHQAWPPVALNNIYTIFYPSGTTIDDGNGTSCDAFGAYHYDVPTNNPIVYAVIPRCAKFGNGGLIGLDATTGALSHELIEASTDPLGTSYAFTDEDHFIWSVAPLGEIGDMCAYETHSYQRLVGSFMVQRTWSNASALLGTDPCVPPLTETYFNAAPVLSDTVTLAYYGQNFSTLGVQIPLNTSKTIDVELFSDAAVAPWYVDATDETDGTGNPPELQFTWDSQTGTNGDVLHMTITRVRNGPYGGSEIYLFSEKSSADYNMWFGFVAN